MSVETHCLHDSLHSSQRAAKLGHMLEAGLNIEATNDLGETPLNYAAKLGKEDGVFQLLQRGANVDAINSAGCTPLQAFLDSPEYLPRGKYAARHILLHKTLPKECASKGDQACVPGCLFGESGEPVVDLLLSAGADIRAGGAFNRSPLGWARYVRRCWGAYK
jgi:hypothetical protein